MVFTVRCFKCGDPAVRLVLGGRAILHARCHACGANLLSEVLEFEQQVLAASDAAATEVSEVSEVSDPPTSELDPEELQLGEMA